MVYQFFGSHIFKKSPKIMLGDLLPQMSEFLLGKKDDFFHKRELCNQIMD